MTPTDLDDLITDVAVDLEASGNVWQFRHNDVQLLVIADPERFDRVRAVTAIVPEQVITDVHRVQMMESNFGSSLDCRYAISGGSVYAVFVHALSSLDPDDFRSVLDQLANLRKSFGTSYDSGVMRLVDPPVQ